MTILIIQELLAYMKKEYSHENLRFWLAVQELKRGPGQSHNDSSTIFLEGSVMNLL